MADNKCRLFIMAWDKIPYWRVGKKKFYFHLPAVLEAASSGQELQFYFYEDIFDQHNWQQEPEVSWESLLKRRAEGLRQKYDYIRLWYSGGADSHTTLLTFLAHDIFIDEIVLMRASPNANFEDPGNSEITFVAKPFLKSIEKYIPKTKIRTLDIGPKEYEFYSSDDWMTQVNYLEFRPTTISHIQHIFPQLYEGIFQKNACDLQGGEKPRITKKVDGEFFAFYWDTQPGTNTGVSQLEQFYISPDLPEIHIKQCHLLKSYIKEKFPQLYPIEPLFKSDSPHWQGLNDCCRYPLYLPYTMGKGKDVFTPKCLHALDQARGHNQRIFSGYHSTMRNFENAYPQIFNDTGVYGGLRGIKTKEYSIGF